MIKEFTLLVVLFFCALSIKAQNAPPVVENVKIAKVDDFLLISYDVFDYESDSLQIIVSASPDSGRTWNLSINEIEGDFGNNVSPGIGKTIRWAFPDEHPDLEVNGLVVRIFAYDRKADEIPFDLLPVEQGKYLRGKQARNEFLHYDFEMMKYEVTNLHFAEFLNELNSKGKLEIKDSIVYLKVPNNASELQKVEELYRMGTEYAYINTEQNKFTVKINYEYHPVAGVSYLAAHSFALRYGMRIPTSAEWEKAARGENPSDYYWGGKADTARATFVQSITPYGEFTTPTGFYNGKIYKGFRTKNSVSDCGAYDMTGNVWEFTSDTVADIPGSKIIKGGSCFSNSEEIKVYSEKVFTGFMEDAGFRCVVSDGFSKPDSISFAKTELASGEEISPEFRLHDAYPNPFNPETVIKINLPEQTKVKIEIFDFLGRRVKELADEVFEAGEHNFRFNGSDLSSGIYFCKMKAKKSVQVKRLILMK